MDKNVFGETIIACSNDPITGYFRDGCCNTENLDFGMHTVCAVMTDEFLAYSKAVGNDLSTPRPEWAFPGLKAGDRWCLCAMRWKEAYDAGMAPKVVLEATNEKTLEVIPLKDLISHAVRNQDAAQ